MKIQRIPLYVIWVTLGLLFCRSAGTAMAADAEPLPTPAELHKAYDDTQYQPLLARLTRVLALKGDAAKPYDHVDLEILRGNTYIQLKQQTSALAAFEMAVKSITDQTPPKLATEATATRSLVKRSQALAYTPKAAADSSPPKPISLLDLSQRKTAFAALLADTRAEVTAKAKAAGASKSLTPIIAGLNSIAELRAIELMATDSDDGSQDIAGQLATQAMGLMDDEVKASSKREKLIHDDANVLIANPTPVADTKSKKKTKQVVPPTTYHKTGLNSNSSRELNAIIDTCHKIETVCKEFEDVAKQQAAGFKAIADSAETTAKEASTTLTADYTSSVTR